MSQYNVYIQSKQSKTNLQCKGNELMKNIIASYGNKTGLTVSEYIFVCNGDKINENQTLEEVSKGSTEVEIVALSEQKEDKLDSVKEEDYIKCNQCSEPAIIEFLENFWITLYDGEHEKKKIKLIDFFYTQLVDQKSIICSKCSKTRDETHQNKFYFCFQCGKNFCPLCQSMHKEHTKIVDYSLKCFRCSQHNKEYVSYCFNCEENFCFYCSERHQDHKIVSFTQLLPKKKLNDEFEEIIKKVEKEVEVIDEVPEQFKKSIDVYKKIHKKLNDNIEGTKLNYQLLTSLKNLIEMPSIKKDLEEIINGKSVDEKKKKIMSIYDMMTGKSAPLNANVSNDVNNEQVSVKNNPANANEIIIKIKIDEEDVNRTVYFLDNSKYHDYLTELDESNTTLIINEERVPYAKSFIPSKSGIYSIKLKFTINLTSCAYMFFGCSKVIDIDFSNFNFQNVTNVDSMFSKCSSLTSLNLSSFNTRNVTDMNHMFYGCLSLTSVNLSSFNTKKVVDMQWMFFNCVSLKSLDLKSFNTQKTNDMSWMFYNCSSLTTLDLSSFNTLNVTSMYEMFYDCSSLTTLNLSSFNASNAQTDSMFYGCKKLSNCVCDDKNIENEIKRA